MDKYHFILVKRYKVIYKDGTQVDLDLKPEYQYYFNTQEQKYLINNLRRSNIDINQVKEIVSYFIPLETEDEVKITIGV